MEANLLEAGNVQYAVKRLLVIAAIGLGVAACAEGAPSSDLIRAHDSSTGAGMDAIVQGVVEVDLEARCVWLSSPEGTRYPVVWPAGTSAQEDPFEIVLPDGTSAVEGNLVSGGGGYIEARHATQRMEPFPDACVHTGEAAVFNAGSAIEVTAGVGLPEAETLVDRISVPTPIGLELIAINANVQSVGVIDFVAGTVHLYQQGHYADPDGPIDGVSGGGGFIHLWSDGVVRSYPGPMDAEPLIFEPEPLVRNTGLASTLEVLPAPDGEHTWLVQDGAGFGPTVVELVNLLGLTVTRLGSHEVEGSWQPVGVTTAGLVLTAQEGNSRALLIGTDGSMVAEVEGEVLAVGWTGAAILGPDGSLFVTDAGLSETHEVANQGTGEWVSVGAQFAPATAPPIVTGAENLLVGLVEESEHPSQGAGELIVLDSSGSTRSIYQLTEGERVATWSRGGDWVALVEPDNVTLIPLRGGEPAEVGDVVPNDHWVITAG